MEPLTPRRRRQISSANSTAPSGEVVLVVLVPRSLFTGVRRAVQALSLNESSSEGIKMIISLNVYYKVEFQFFRLLI